MDEVFPCLLIGYRLRVDNRDRRLAVGMTAYVLMPVQ